MKKILIAAALLAAFGMSSCSKNENVVPSENSNIISFKTYNSQSTKVVEDVNLVALQANGFNVQGRLSADGVQFMTERNATWGGTAWTYDGALMYWPTDGNIDFLAVNKDKAKVKMGKVSSFIENIKAPTVTYTQAAAVAAQKDLVIAYAPGSTKGTDGAVALKFKHALSKISAMVKANSTDTTLTLKITSITFKTVLPKGVCTISGNTTDTTPFTWEASETGADLALGLNLVPGKSYIALPGETTPALKDVLVATTGHAMIIPQTMTTIKIAGYWEQTVDGVTAIVDNFSGDASHPVKTITLTDSAEPAKSWAANKHYTYNFTITPGITAVSFTATVDDWTSETVEK